MVVHFFVLLRSRSFSGVVVCKGVQSDTLSDALSSPLTILHVVVHFFVSSRSRSFASRIRDQQVVRSVKRSVIRSAFLLQILHLAVHFLLSLIKIIFFCVADWGPASDALSDALSSPP